MIFWNFQRKPGKTEKNRAVFEENRAVFEFENRAVFGKNRAVFRGSVFANAIRILNFSSGFSRFLTGFSRFSRFSQTGHVSVFVPGSVF